jgi:hypothetical protein
MTAGRADLRADGAAAIARRIRSHDVSVISVVEDHLERIASAKDAVGGVAWTDDGAVLDAARAADRALTDGTAPIGPLHGRTPDTSHRSERCTTAARRSARSLISSTTSSWPSP